MTSPIKLICLDYDGVLANLRVVHHEAFNTALSEIDPKFIISPEEHTKLYDGLSTKRKLALLVANKDFPTDARTHERVFARKQELTIEAIKRDIKPNPYLHSVLTELRNRSYKTCVVSNAIHDTIYQGLLRLGVWQLFDRIYCNTDTINQKPHPECYLRAMVEFGVSSDETLVVEDSKHGREAAYRSGAFVCGVDNPDDLTLERIERALNAAKPKPKRWTGGGVNIVIPASGRGSRFAQQGYVMPKPLIDVAGKPMLQRVVENIGIDAHFIFVVQREHYDGYYLGTLLNSIAPGCDVICVDGQTEGAACSVLKARHLIDNDDKLIIANSDQIMDWDVCGFMWQLVSQNLDGQILTFKGNESKWSYAREENGWVVEVAEKKVISNDATCGLYAYKRGSDFVRAADQMIAKNIRTNNEFYVAPTYNEAILEYKKIKTFLCQKLIGLGTPEELKVALQSEYFK